jgi:pilus assembly protein FimV
VATTAAAPAPAEEYGPVRRSETLWSIAERVRPDESVSMHQMMMALLRENPDAFVNGNMNLLKAGSTLKVPGREEILSMSASEALAETQRQYSEWEAMAGAGTDAAERDAETAAPGPSAETAQAAAADTASGARLQLVAPEGDAVEGAAMPGDPQAAASASAADAELAQQLALATEEAAASKAQSSELQSRVDDLEAQVATMKRLLELKDEALAGLQNQVASGDTEAQGMPETPVAAAVSEEAAVADMAGEAATDDKADGTATAAPAEEDVTAETLPGAGAEQATAAAGTTPAPAEPVEPVWSVAGIMAMVSGNPVLAAAAGGALLLLIGIIWLARRRRDSDDGFDDEMPLASRLAGDADQAGRGWPQPVFDIREEADAPVPEAPVAQDEEPLENDPVTEADVYLAYGRIQQAEDVLQAAQQRDPDNEAIHLKLMEVYHIAGNTASFDRAAAEFRAGVEEDDPRWLKIASMGYTMAPHNELYRAGAPADEIRKATAPQESDTPDVAEAADNSIDFDMDLSGMDSVSGTVTEDDLGLDLNEPARKTEDQPETIEYGLDELEEEESYDGMLASEDEVTTKLDLARAYIDMDDKDSARSILGEVMEEGNAAQKQEAEKIFAQIA